MSRLNVLGLIICLMLAGCGIQVRTPPAPMVPPKPASFADPVAARPNPTLPPVNTAPLVLAPGQTVVSITFDDGRASNAYGAEMLTDHHLPGTFFINSGNIGKPGYLTMPQLDGIAAEGHEIGGHTVNHPDLATDTTDEIAAADLRRPRNPAGLGISGAQLRLPVLQRQPRHRGARAATAATTAPAAWVS